MLYKNQQQKYNILKDIIIKYSRNQENINLNIFNNIKRVIKAQDVINNDIINDIIKLKDIIINDIKDLKEKNKELEDKINENTNNIYYIFIGIFIILLL
jgi:hypothetical protein